MGRITLKLFLISILLLLLFQSAFGLEINVIWEGSVSKYYFGGEYIVLKTVVEPKTYEDAEGMDNSVYKLSTGLDSGGIFAEVSLNGTKILHPAPTDVYKRENNFTILEFYVPKGDGVENLTLKIFGFVPEIDRRILNITLLELRINSEDLILKNVTVVNKHKIYRDIRDLRKEICDEKSKRKLDDALLLYNDGKYWEAERKIREVEEAVAKCKFEEEKNKLLGELENIENELFELHKQIIIFRTELELKKDELENYETIKLKYANVSASYDEAKFILSRAKELVNSGKFDDARLKLDDVKSSISTIKSNLIKLQVEVKHSKKKFNWIWFSIPVLLLAAILLIKRRKKGNI